MPIVTVTLRDSSYALACDAGQEDTLQSLAKALDERIGTLSTSQGKGSDIRLLIMTALTMEDEINDLKAKLAAQRLIANDSSPVPLAPAPNTALCQELNNVAERLEVIASELDLV